MLLSFGCYHMSTYQSKTMREARIVVTANPTGWEGDSRTWEALASGAMVMVDKLETPLPHPLLDKVHVVYFDSSDKEGFLKLLKYYLDHPDEAKVIGINGHAHAVKYHRTVTSKRTHISNT
jgi:spore maturation protein CgeB